MIARSERTYLIDGVQRDIRNDARSRNTLRGFQVDKSNIEQASGSCEVTVPDNGSHVLVGVKTEIAPVELPEHYVKAEVGTKEYTQSHEHYHNRGKVICTVECSPAVARFLDSREATEMCALYSEYMNRLLNNPGNQDGDEVLGLDLKSLCIIPDNFCWIVRVDCLVLEYGGNLLDTLMVAVRGALADTKLPQIEIVESDGAIDFTLADEETEPLKGANDIPTTISFYKIGQRHVLDPTPSEELCSSCHVSVSMSSTGKAVLVEKFGSGGLNPLDLVEYLKIAKTITPQYHLHSSYLGKH